MTRRQAQNVGAAIAPDGDYKVIPDGTDGWMVAIRFGGDGKPSGSLVITDGLVRQVYDKYPHDIAKDSNVTYHEYLWIPGSEPEEEEDEENDD